MTMFLIWGASWVHWTDPPDRTMFSMIFASFAGVAFATAIIIRKGWVFWATALGMVGLWLCALVLHVIHFFQEMSLGLGMELFSVLWLLAFLHLGLAIKTVKDRSLSFSYLLVALFFFIIATLEIFVMKEYLGGDYERNNSLFKFGINAWELASITVGIFLPKIISSFAFLLKAVKKEAALPRVLLLFVSAAFLFILFHNLLDSFLSSMGTPIVYVIDMVLVGGFLGWGWVEKWVKNAVVKITCLVLGGILILLSLLALLPQDSGAMSIAQRWASDFDVNVLFPALLAAVVLGILNLIWEGQRNMGRLMVFNSWRALVALFALTVLVYPCLATVRKCHGFFDGTRKQWVSYIEKVTLDGLEYLPRENPYDAAAIQFLNDHVPGQPCLVEFVGEGYNSWGSRFSIFTGIPAIMGWDGHVKEWLTGRAGHDQDIDQRFQATETIFRTLDPQLAKKYLDTYGIRLVMVGTVERGGVPGRKGGYPPEGLAKFPGFLPLIYKNPQVEIYYNPPPTN
jgi:uncharacterized membrane protein